MKQKGNLTMTIKSPNFGEIIITGENAQTAADWLTQELASATKAQEILLHREAMQQFNIELSVSNSHVEGKENIPHCLI